MGGLLHRPPKLSFQTETLRSRDIRISQQSQGELDIAAISRALSYLLATQVGIPFLLRGWARALKQLSIVRILKIKIKALLRSSKSMEK